LQLAQQTEEVPRMADRLVAETERLRTTIRAGAWSRATPILRRLTALVAARTGESSTPPAPGRRHGATWIPLTAFAHEVHRDRRTVRRRLDGTKLLQTKNGVEVVHVEAARPLFPESRG
jgi:hypothetical protein